MFVFVFLCLGTQKMAAEGHGLFVKLDLADNVFKEAGGALLANALKCQPNLTFLNLRDAGLCDEGVVAVCEALTDAATAPGLTFLDLSGNELTEESMSAVFACVTAKPNLVSLGMEENELGSDGGNALAAALAAAPATLKTKLNTLLLGTNEISGKAGVALAKALDGYSAITKLGMNGNFFSTDALAEIESILEKFSLTGALGEDPFDENDDEGDEDE